MKISNKDNRKSSRFVKKLITLKALLLLTFYLPVHGSNLPEQLLKMPIKLTSGETVSLAQYQGKKPVYLKFWATWCQPCRQEMPHFEHIQQKYGDNVEVIGINLGINDDINAIRSTQKEFSLTMPMALDTNGDLAQAFRLLGTPYHLLFDKQINLLYVSNAADEVLDNKLALVSKQKPINLLEAGTISETARDISIDLNDGKVHALFFTATWCDWYLKDSRPNISQNCVVAQTMINQLAKQVPEISWHGILSRLWTGSKDKLAYQKKYEVQYPLSVDHSNRLFHQFTVKDLPTLIVVKNGKVLLKTSNFSRENNIGKQLQTL
ncbi:redoxin domain-containing protein [Aliikangiella coralliicola]|uniref:Redoxin domain-containing protein n=1 Tax=Aliikangiella coralliicola TaxID=2592383 RepID=A0A545UIN5_9GAMM|nr:redoxin domain-containing protein [Aliikangiella coralliicola]TQV89326.1 redoxin domain-containing protein [Aliikangiella coralliicola]